MSEGDAIGGEAYEGRVAAVVVEVGGGGARQVVGGMVGEAGGNVGRGEGGVFDRKVGRECWVLRYGGRKRERRERAVCLWWRYGTVEMGGTV